MTSGMTEEHLRGHITPQLVNLEFHGESVTVTFLVGGNYYTVERVRPDFPTVSDDTVLERPTEEPGMTRLNKRRVALVEETRKSGRTPEHACALALIYVLNRDHAVAYGTAWQEYLRSQHPDGVEPTNPAYYHAKRRFTTAWLNLTELLRTE